MLCQWVPVFIFRLLNPHWGQFSSVLGLQFIRTGFHFGGNHFENIIILAVAQAAWAAAPVLEALLVLDRQIVLKELL
jgi:hypothetical protein